MKTSRLATLATVALLGGAMLWTHTSAQTAAPAATRIAICDLVDVFNNYQRAKDLTARLNERREAIKAESKKRSDAIDALRQELENYKKGTKKFKETLHQIQWQSLQAQGWLKYQDSLALEEHRDLTKEMYTEIKAMIAKVASQRGVTMVLQREPEELQTEDTTQLLRQIYGQKVLYHAEELDMTEAVLLALNQAYRAKTPAKANP